jgi:nicotinamide mononucleotide transporter
LDRGLNESIHTFFQEARSLGWVQWLSFVTGLLYIYFAAKNNPWCWPWGIVSSGLWAYASWFQLHLLSDSILQLIYVVLGFWGWYSWYYRRQQASLSITYSKAGSLVVYGLTSLILSIVLGAIMRLTNAAFPMIDAFLSVFSVTATLLLVQQKIENWWLWMVINLTSIPLFIIRGGWLFAILFLIYFCLSIAGWIAWRKTWLKGHTGASL